MGIWGAAFPGVILEPELPPHGSLLSTTPRGLWPPEADRKIGVGDSMSIFQAPPPRRDMSPLFPSHWEKPVRWAHLEDEG